MRKILDSRSRHRAILGSAVLALVTSLAGCGGDSATDPSSATTTSQQAPFNATDTDFVLGAGQFLGSTLTVAQLAQTASSDPDVQGLARDLAAAKGPQVDQVASWLRRWGKQGAEFGHDAAAPEAVEPKAGLSDQTLGRLTALTGPQFDRLFLSAIAIHLEAGSRLWKVEAAEGENPAAIGLAKQLQREEADFARRARAFLVCCV